MLAVNTLIAILSFTIIAAFTVIIFLITRLQDKSHALRRERKLRRDAELKNYEAIEAISDLGRHSERVVDSLTADAKQRMEEQLDKTAEGWRKMDSLFEAYKQRLSSIEVLNKMAASSMNAINELSDSLHGQVNAVMASLLESETVKSSTESARDSADEKEGVQAASKES
jgi:hypothetical protein